MTYKFPELLTYTPPAPYPPQSHGFVSEEGVCAESRELQELLKILEDLLYISVTYLPRPIGKL
jgi:hypothetical protein